MPIGNDVLLEKADTQLSSFTTSDGLLQPDKADKFIREAVISARLLSMLRVDAMKKPEMILPKLGISGRVSHAASHGVALTQSQRTAITPTGINMTTKEFVAEVDLNDGIMEDNIERKTLWNTVNDMMKKRIARDIQENILEGDTTSADVDLAAFDGMLKLATSHVHDASTTVFSLDHGEAMMDLIPEQYAEDESKLRFLCSLSMERKYRKALASRMGALGDALLTSKRPISVMGITLEKIAGWPNDLHAGSSTDSILMPPKLARVGFWRQIRMEMDRDPRARSTAHIWSYRVGFQYEEEDAVVKGEDFLIA
jgi:hypothetical protein